MPQINSKLHENKATGDKEAIQHLKQSIADGKIWYIALLEAISLWTSPEEHFNNHHYRYLIDGEAFDWLLLIERLCCEIADVIPEKELLDLLFYGKLPQPITEEEFKELIGDAKYRAYLNYLYGVTVEYFILLAIEEEIFKENHAHFLTRTKEEPADSYQRLYGATQETLLHLFMEDKKYPYKQEISINELQEFTYWLFKFRLKNSDRAKLASDTKKGIEHFRNQRSVVGMTISKNDHPQPIEDYSLSRPGNWNTTSYKKSLNKK